jgi:hypothetical protein
MSRPGTLKPQPSLTAWCKHLRRPGKRQAAKMERASVRSSLRHELPPRSSRSPP